MATIEVKVPDIGDFDEVSVIELLVKPGDTVKAEQSLVTVESDKASMEIPSSAAGVVKELRIKLGDKVKQGSLILVLESTVMSSPSAPAGSPPPQPSPGSGEGAKPVAVTVPAAAAAAGPIEVRVPDIGDFKDVAVIELLVKPGDTVKPEQSLITVESDKASMEIPSSAGGVVKELKVKLGDKLNIGDLVAVLEGTATSAPSQQAGSPPSQPTTARGQEGTSAAAPAAVPERTPPTAALPPHEPGPPGSALPHASPSVRKFARELGVPLDEVKGSGPKGRITQEDVQGFTRSVMSSATQTRAASAKTPAGGGGGAELNLLPWPKVDFSKFGPVERKDLSRIKKISGANLHRNWVMIPHVNSYEDADITELEDFRVSTNLESEKSGKASNHASVKVTMLALVIKAVVAALKKFPDFNASLDGEQLVYKQYFHIGFAADTPGGLVVPVLRDADRKGILQISQEMGELAKKARDGKLTVGDMQGGCFSISSLGGLGTTYFTPIINAPEVAILGLSRSAMKPVWDGKAFQPRLVLPLSLSYDHRVIDGASGARFTTYLAQVLADFRRVLL